MIEWFFNLINLLFVILFFLIGATVMLVMTRYAFRPKNAILYFRERDGRGLELDLVDEDPISFKTKSNPPLRFFKFGRSYEFRKRGRAFTRFLGKEGTAYTYRLEGFTKEGLPEKVEKTPEKPKKRGRGRPRKEDKAKENPDRPPAPPVEPTPQKVVVEFPTLEDAVRSKWGEPFYRHVPEAKKEILREDKLLITVGLEPGLTPKGYEPITEETITDRSDEEMGNLFARAAKGIIKKDIWERFAYIGVGVAVGFGIHIFLLA